MGSFLRSTRTGREFEDNTLVKKDAVATIDAYTGVSTIQIRRARAATE